VRPDRRGERTNSRGVNADSRGERPGGSGVLTGGRGVCTDGRGVCTGSRGVNAERAEGKPRFTLTVPSWVTPGTHLENLLFIDDTDDTKTIGGVELLFFIYDDSVRDGFMRKLPDIRRLHRRRVGRGDRNGRGALPFLCGGIFRGIVQRGLVIKKINCYSEFIENIFLCRFTKKMRRGIDIFFRD
jgi:hypothetical protein